MSCHSSGVLQPSGLIEAGLSYIGKLSFSKQFDLRWANAESRITELLSGIQPNGQSELQRQAVADYVSGLVKKCLDCEVFRFGSVPLKTYLPDGDIDLTAFSSHQELKDSWALDVQAVLEHEVQKKDAKFTVSNVQCIHAEVKIVKCVVENVVVDISFNQLGGLCTLCFLEEVDRLIQKNHLFKRSILLVKAWCYYESRILGAHHALISTYALETLVLYIFNVFHSTLRGPLEVMLTFLDYFSKFDWENYCISLWGPVPLASLPDLTALPPLKDGSNLLLSKGFLEECSALYDVFPKGGDTQARTFSGKYLNIVDPLRVNNNLGRSVSQANYHRIKRAFHLGARQLARVFDVIDEDFPKCLDNFFSNTWERHQSGHRPDAPTSVFPPYEKFVYKTGLFDMPGDHRGQCLSSSPKLEKSSMFSNEKTIKDEKSSSQSLHSGMLMEHTTMKTAEQKSVKDLLRESHMQSDHDGIINLTSQAGSWTPKTMVRMQSALFCNMPSAVSTDSQLRTSALRNSRLDEFQSITPMHTHKASASLERMISERRLEKNPDVDIMKTCGPPETICQIELRESPLKKESQGSCTDRCSPVEVVQGAGMLKAQKSSSCVPDFSPLKEADDVLGAMHRQRSGKIAFMRGKSWPSLNTRESNERSAAASFASNSTNPGRTSSTLADLRIIDMAMQKPPDFLFPESRDLLYATNILSSLPQFSSSSSAVEASSPFPGLSAFSEVDVHMQDSVCVSSVQVTYMMPVGFSGGPTLGDVQSFAGPMTQLGGPNIAQMPSRGQISEDQHLQLQILQQPDQAWFTSNVDWEHKDVHLLSSNNRPTPHAEAPRSNDASIIASKTTITGYKAVPSDVQEFPRTVETDGKMQEYFDTLFLSRRKGDSEAITLSSPGLAPDINPDGCIHPQVPHLPINMTLISFCEELPIHAPSCPQILPTTAVSVSKSSISGPSEGFGSVQRVVQQPYNIQGAATLCSPVRATPVVSYYNPFYPAFPANGFSQHIPYGNKIPRGGPPQHRYHCPRQISESTAAALNARFASLSAEASAMEPQRDLLRSDLANHLRNLEFGRWCQEPVVQPISEPPFVYYSSQQDPYVWGISPFMSLHGSSNQVLDNLKGPGPVVFSTQNAGGMPHIASRPGTSENSHLHKQEAGTGTFLPVRNGMYRDGQAQITLQHDPRKKAQLPLTVHTSAVPALVSWPVCHDAYNGETDAQVFVNNDGEHGVLSSDFPNQAWGRDLPFVAGRLEFGSLGPIEIVSFPCTDVGTKK